MLSFLLNIFIYFRQNNGANFFNAFAQNNMIVLKS